MLLMLRERSMLVNRLFQNTRSAMGPLDGMLDVPIPSARTMPAVLERWAPTVQSAMA